MRYSFVAGLLALSSVPASVWAQQQPIGPSQTNPLDYDRGQIPGTSVPTSGVVTPPVVPTTTQPVIAPPVPSNPTAPVSTQLTVTGRPLPPVDLTSAAPSEAVPEPLRPHPGGLTADLAAERALQRSGPALQIARANIEIARAGASEAGRNMIPQLSTSFRYTRLSPYEPTAVLFGGNPVQLAPAILDQFDWRTTLTIPITDIPLRIYPNYRSATLQADAAVINMEATRAQTGLEAREAFYEYVRAIGQEYLVNQSITALQRRLEDVNRAVQAGTVARASLLQLEAQLADLQRSTVLAHTAVTINETLVRQRLHLAPGEPIVVGETLDALPPLPTNVEEMISRAYTLRPEIVALSRQIEALDRQIFATRASQFPSVAFAGNFDYANPNTRFFPQTRTWQPTWDATIQVTWNATNAVIADATMSRLRAQQNLLAAQQAQLREGIEVQVRQYFSAAQSAAAQVQSTRVALASALENYRVVRERIQAGAAVGADLAQAETDLLRARLNAINAIIDARLAMARIRRATGEREMADAQHVNP
jgi:outer membrane protein TolC